MTVLFGNNGRPKIPVSVSQSCNLALYDCRTYKGFRKVVSLFNVDTKKGNMQFILQRQIRPGHPVSIRKTDMLVVIARDGTVCFPSTCEGIIRK